MLTSDEINKIAEDLITGRAPRILGEEADKLRQELEKDIMKIREAGYQLELPFEWQDVGEK